VSLVFRAFVAPLLAILFFSNSFAGMDNEDQWLARDKYGHFAVSVFYSAGVAKIAHRHFELSKNESLVFGFGVTITLGAAKEAGDRITRKGTPSFKDFIWDLAGALTGALVAKLTL
jgi:putative lipoprotein